MAGTGHVWARKFSRLLELYPHPDGHRWKGVELEQATNGFISGSYVTALRKGRIEEPGLNRLRRIAEVMGFSFLQWFEDLEGLQREERSAADDAGGSVSERLNQLFAAAENEHTGEPYTEREVSRLSHGRVSEEQVSKMRSGELDNPTRAQLLALCDVFDVDLSYWDERRPNGPLMSPDTLRALRDAESLAILHKSHELPDEDKSLIMVMMQELERRRDLGEEREGG